MDNELIVQERLDQIKVKLKVIIDTGNKSSYHLKDTSLSLLRKACEELCCEMKEESEPNGWSCDYIYSIYKGKDRIWFVEGSLWYGEMILSKV